MSHSITGNHRPALHEAGNYLPPEVSSENGAYILAMLPRDVSVPPPSTRPPAENRPRSPSKKGGTGHGHAPAIAAKKETKSTPVRRSLQQRQQEEDERQGGKNVGRPRTRYFNQNQQLNDMNARNTFFNALQGSPKKELSEHKQPLPPPPFWGFYSQSLGEKFRSLAQTEKVDAYAPPNAQRTKDYVKALLELEAGKECLNDNHEDDDDAEYYEGEDGILVQLRRTKRKSVKVTPKNVSHDECTPKSRPGNKKPTSVAKPRLQTKVAAVKYQSPPPRYHGGMDSILPSVSVPSPPPPPPSPYLPQEDSTSVYRHFLVDMPQWLTMLVHDILDMTRPFPQAGSLGFLPQFDTLNYLEPKTRHKLRLEAVRQRLAWVLEALKDGGISAALRSDFARAARLPDFLHGIALQYARFQLEFFCHVEEMMANK